MLEAVPVACRRSNRLRRLRSRVGGGTDYIVEASLNCWKTPRQRVGGVNGCVLEACGGGIDSVLEP